MLPDFLKQFEKNLEKYKREYIKIIAKPISNNEIISLTQSKFAGLPFLPTGVEYPVDKQGKPMQLWAQINFNESPQLISYPVEGILQLFVSDEWFNMDDYKIIYYDNTNYEIQTNFPFINENTFENTPFEHEHKLTFSKETEYGGSEDSQFFGYEFNGLSYYDYKETLSEEQQKQLEKYFYSIGHRIGGYAYFTQSDPRGIIGTRDTIDDALVLQIDSDDKIMIGDVGVAHIFLNKADLMEKRFENAYFHYDCC